MKPFEPARSWIATATALAALGLPLFAEPSAQVVSGAQGLPRKQAPKVAFFRPGDVYGACGSFGPNGPGAVFKLDPVSGSSIVLATLEQGGFANPGNSSLLDYDATLDRLVAWAKLPGIPSNNFGFVLLFVDASGGYTYIDLPAQTAPAGLTCTGTGRTYINLGSTVYYIDGMDPTATLSEVMDVSGLVPYSNTATLGFHLNGWAYDESLNALVGLYTTSASACAGKNAAGIHVLPLLSGGTQVASNPGETATPFWDSSFPPCDENFAGSSLSRVPGGTFMADVRFQQSSGSGARFEAFAVDPLTMIPGAPQLFASFVGCDWHTLNASCYSWKHGFVFGSDNFHNFQPGGLHLFPQGTHGCGIMGPGPYLGGEIRFVSILP